MQNDSNETMAEVLQARLAAAVPEDDMLLFRENFSLLRAEDGTFVFSYKDKTAYAAFLGKYKNALMAAAGAACGKIPNIKFRYCAPGRGEQAQREERRQAKKRTVQSAPKVKDISKNRSFKKGIRNILASLVCLIAAFSLAVVGINVIANLKFKENFYSLSLGNTYDNFRIIQLSDLHNATYGNRNADLLNRIEKLKPDIIAMTGDCLDADGDLDEIIDLCTALAEIAPTYYIYGNNEWERAFGCGNNLDAIDAFIGSDGQSHDSKTLYSADCGLKEALEKTGVKVLFNESDTVRIGSTKVKIFGTLTSNPSAFWDYAGTAFSEYLDSDDDCVKITLCHEPLLLETLEEETFGGLVLCGDTHGGVVRLPVLGAVYSRDFGLFPERGDHMIYGKYKAGNSEVIVSSGLTNRGFPRIFNQPELVIVDVNKY